MLIIKYVTSSQTTHALTRHITNTNRRIFTSSPIYAYAGGRRSHYEVLGVSRDCTTKEVRNAYLEKCKILHPDVAKNKRADDSEFIAVKHAYEILVDEQKRSVYDNYTRYTKRTRDPSWQAHKQAMKDFHEFYGIRQTPPGYKFQTRYSNILVLWFGVLLACIGGLIQVGFVLMDNKRIVNEFQRNSKRLLEEAMYDGDMEKREYLVNRYKSIMEETRDMCPDPNSPLFFWSLQKVMVKHEILGKEYLNGQIMDSNFLLNTLMEQEDYLNLKINTTRKS